MRSETGTINLNSPPPFYWACRKATKKKLDKLFFFNLENGETVKNTKKLYKLSRVPQNIPVKVEIVFKEFLEVLKMVFSGLRLVFWNEF